MTEIPRRILVPTDFSAGAERALRLALRIGSRFGSEIHLLHVHVLLDDTHVADDHRTDVQRMIAEGEEAARRALTERASASSLEVTTHVMRRLAPAEAIAEAAAEHECDLVVIGSHGRRGFKSWLLGSVTEEVVRTAPVPVLTVREEVPETERSVRRILVPHDFSERSQAALEVAAAWARALGAEVHLLHVVEPVVYPDFYAVDLLPQEMMERVKIRSLRSLREAGAAHLEGVPFRPEVLVGRAAATIVDEAAGDEVDLVVMGTHGLTGLEHVLLGSVAEAVAHRSPTPVLIVRTG